jgi:putative phosphoesterase
MSAMRIAALYDIHGNLAALEAALRDVERAAPDRIVIGGDVAAGPFPRETLVRLEALGDRALYLSGNADRGMLASLGAPAREGDVWAQRDRWAAERLDDAQRERMGRWPATLALEIDGLGATLFAHATPRSDEEILTRASPEARVRDALAETIQRVFVCGHTHVRYERAITGWRIVNPGSVGMAYEGSPGVACWALLGPGIELRRVTYDFARAAEEIRASGYPGADEFARRYVLDPPTADEATLAFERRAGS